ncbi:MAG: V-type ATPase 116kDa subunit family protein [Cytophagales bacterium]
MKAKMKKATFMIYHRDTQQILNSLQEKGLVHLDIQSTDENEASQELSKYISKIESILDEMDEHSHQADDLKASEVLEDYDLLNDKVSEYSELLEKYQKDFRLLKPWGNIKWKRIRTIEELNWTFNFYIAPSNSFLQIEDDPYVLEVARKGGNVYFVNIQPLDRSKSLPFEQLELPKLPLGEVGRLLSQTEEEIIKLQQSIQSLSKYRNVLEKHLSELLDKLMILNASNSMNEAGEGRIKYINAWFPLEMESKIQKELETLDLAYEIKDPGEQDDVPVVLKNNTYNKIFENITKVYQLPNYHELDLTPFIGVFYPIFFAYCLGDAGYGIVLSLLAVWAYLGPLKKMKTVALLGLVLGIATTFVGIIKSGTVFGLSIAETKNIPLFDSLSKYIFITDNQDFIFNAFNVSLMIGLVQILVGVVLSFYRKLKYQSFSMAIPMVAKFLIISSSVALFLGASQEMELLMPFVGLSKVALLLGIVILLFTHDFSIPVVSRVMKGLLEVFFVFTGILGDSLSYIRLFALGVSSSILGLVVNQIGAPLLESGILGIIGGIVFLIFGHALNFAIAFLGALIHPLRLTFVEFYGNAQFEGGGKEFKPFKKNQLNL